MRSPLRLPMPLLPPDTGAGRAHAAPDPRRSHDCACSVTFTRAHEPDADMVLDLGTLDLILAEEIVAPYHGKHLNLEVPEFGYGKALPTCEATARDLLSR